MKKLVLLLFILSVLSELSGFEMSEQRLKQRIEEYKEVFNHAAYDTGAMYDMLCEEYRGRISREDFCAAYGKEISYPYITPFYIFYPEYSANADFSRADVVYQQAARIVGMTWKTEILYENGDYYFRDWDYLIDGSYLEKFEDIPYSLDWYYSGGDAVRTAE